MTKGLITTRKIGVLMGGESPERDISIRSGLAIYQSLQEMGYGSVPIDISKDIVNALKKEKIKFAFLALHGGIGENGAMQGMLEVLGIPYTGSGLLASALAMDKEVSKKIFIYHGLPAAPFVIVSQKSKVKSHPPPPPLAKGGQRGGGNFELQTPDFPLPWVVKPVAGGSSIGVSIIKEEKDLNPSLEKAFSLGQRVMIEKFIPGKEVHIGMLGHKVLGGVEVRPSLEFYNYEAKYTSGLTDYIIPPEIDEATYENAKGIALKAHQALGCSGASRVDLRLDEGSVPHILEVNTLPGMTTTSLLPKIAKSAGISFNGLIEEIIRLALKE
ncbi:MAG: D-alanine--D-alanine ligase [Nitrospirae bacterium]|nr:D-alanine--D-alanine ligase [Nitrospirota bacterium]